MRNIIVCGRKRQKRISKLSGNPVSEQAVFRNITKNVRRKQEKQYA